MSNARFSDLNRVFRVSELWFRSSSLLSLGFPLDLTRSTLVLQTLVIYGKPSQGSMSQVLAAVMVSP